MQPAQLSWIVEHPLRIRVADPTPAYAPRELNALKETGERAESAPALEKETDGLPAEILRAGELPT